MRRMFAAMVLPLLLSCGKKEPPAETTPAASSPPPPSDNAASAAPTASASAAPAASAASAVPPPNCPAGMTGNGFPAYCIKVPSGYAVKSSRISPKRGSIDYDTGTTTDNLMVSYDDSPLPQVTKDVEAEMKFGGDKIEKKGHLAGKSRWYLGSHAEYERMVAVVPGQGGLTLKCSFAYQAKKPPSKDAIEACKSITVP